MSIKKCISCGAELDVNAKFCGECGKKQEEQKQTCPSCGTEMPERAKFCPECGTPLSAASDTHISVDRQGITPFPNCYGDVEVFQPNEATISISIKGISFHLKYVGGYNNGFFIGETPVTQALWSAVMGENPSKDNSNLDYPVTNIDRTYITAFLNKLNRLTGVKFELPTISQWRYAYIGSSNSQGFRYSGGNNMDEVGWHDEKLHPVAQLVPNELGLYDMDGNVSERCNNCNAYYDYRDNDKELDEKYNYQLPDELFGFRVIINIPEKKIIPQNILEWIVYESQKKVLAFNKEKHAEKERQKSLCNNVHDKDIIDIKFDGGILRYLKNDNLNKIVPSIFGPDYEALDDKANQLFNEANSIAKSNKKEWKVFGKRIGRPRSKYNESIEFCIHNNDTLILRGRGPMPYLKSFKDNSWCFNDEIMDLENKLEYLIILDGITTIKDFRYLSFLKMVVMADSVEEIDSFAFAHSSLQYIRLSKKLKTIGSYAFTGTRLTGIFIPKRVEHIKDNAFSVCFNLKTALLGDSTTLDGGEEGVFNHDDKLWFKPFIELEEEQQHKSKKGTERKVKIEEEVRTGSVSLPAENAEIKVATPDKSTISITINGVPFNLKLVRGQEYGTDCEIADFFIGETPVTQALWSVILGDNPSSDNTNLQYPVTNINSSSATSLLVALMKLTGVKFELPTGVQWKYAYKGGNKSKGYKYSGSNDVAEIGWTDMALHPVGQLFANELGLTDMEGNVEELLKGNEWAKISINAKAKLKGNELSGMRLVINIPVDEILEGTTALQAAIAKHQAVILPEREAEIQERKRHKEEEARIKAEEEAKRKAEEEAARAKAAEEARIKAEINAQKKAEEEAKKKAAREAARIKAAEEARLLAEREAKAKAEKQAKINSLKEELSALQHKDVQLKNELDSFGHILQEKKQVLSKIENFIQDCNIRLKGIEEATAELERRFNVVLTKRVDYGFFSTKGTKFDEVLMALTGESKEQIKEWNSSLRKKKEVTISCNRDKEEASRYKSVIDQAGGEAIIESPLSDAEYEKQKSGYILEGDQIKTDLIENQERAASLNKEIAVSENAYRQLSAKHTIAHLSFKKCDLEIKFLESNQSVSNFIQEASKDDNNRPALAELFISEYEAFKKIEEETRLKAEQEEKIKAQQEEKKRIKAEQAAQKRLAEEQKKKADKEMKEKTKGLVLYSKGDGAETAYHTVFEKKRKGLNKSIQSLYSAVENAIEEGEIEWEDYLTDFYYNKSVLKYAIVDDNILIVKGKGVIPDVELDEDNEGLNKWHINPEVREIDYEIEKLIITGGITRIGARCFADFDNLETVVMCDSIETIGEACFSNDEELKNVKLSQSLREIKDNAFKSTAIQQIFLPAGVKKIGKNAFKECVNLETVLVPKNATIDKDAFRDCNKLKK